MSSPDDFEKELHDRGFRCFIEDDIDGGPSVVLWFKNCDVPGCGTPWQAHRMSRDALYDDIERSLVLQAIRAGDCPHPEGTLFH